jgi:hypothetical protein
MSTLLLDEETLNSIAYAIDKARKNVIPLDVVKEKALAKEKSTLELKDRPPGYEPLRSSEQVLIPFGYRAAISFEHQPLGLCRHLSISIEKDPGTMPGVEAVKIIADHFGISFEDSNKWVEEYEPGRYAINLVSLDQETMK